MMNALTLKEVVSVTATVSTVLQFLMGTEVCIKIRRKGSTADISAFQFACGVLGCSLWLRYAVLLPDKAMLIVNAIGIILQTSYLVIFWAYTLQKGPLIKLLVTVSAALGFILGYTFVEEVPELRMHRLGLAACSSSLMFCAAPLVSLAEVVRKKSTDCMSFPLILATFFVSGQWYIYGYLIKDTFVQMPNLIGCLLAAFQLSLFGFYPSPRVKTHRPAEGL